MCGSRMGQGWVDGGWGAFPGGDASRTSRAASAAAAARFPPRLPKSNSTAAPFASPPSSPPLCHAAAHCSSAAAPFAGPPVASATASENCCRRRVLPPRSPPWLPWAAACSACVANCIAPSSSSTPSSHCQRSVTPADAASLGSIAAAPSSAGGSVSCSGILARALPSLRSVSDMASCAAAANADARCAQTARDDPCRTALWLEASLLSPEPATTVPRVTASSRNSKSRGTTFLRIAICGSGVGGSGCRSSISAESCVRSSDRCCQFTSSHGAASEGAPRVRSSCRSADASRLSLSALVGAGAVGAEAGVRGAREAPEPEERFFGGVLLRELRRVEAITGDGDETELRNPLLTEAYVLDLTASRPNVIESWHDPGPKNRTHRRLIPLSTLSGWRGESTSPLMPSCRGVSS